MDCKLRKELIRIRNSQLDLILKKNHKLNPNPNASQLHHKFSFRTIPRFLSLNQKNINAVHRQICGNPSHKWVRRLEFLMLHSDRRKP